MPHNILKSLINHEFQRFSSKLNKFRNIEKLKKEIAAATKAADEVKKLADMVLAPNQSRQMH
jgi:ribosomal protein L29